MKKIGITMRADVSARGERRNALDMQWPELLLSMNFFPVLLPNIKDAAPAIIEQHNLSALILSGGNDTIESGTSFDRIRQDFELNLLAAAADRKLPVVGICRGMQMINLFCGGMNNPIDNHVAQDHIIHWNGEALKVNSFHTYGICEKSLGENLQVEAAAEDGSIEAFKHTQLQWYGVMWHPERPIADADIHHRWLSSILSGKAQ